LFFFAGFFDCATSSKDEYGVATTQQNQLQLQDKRLHGGGQNHKTIKF
jgi:hypothetical protein